MALTPVHNNVIVERNEAEAYTQGGVYLGASAEDTQNTGVVVGVGPGIWEYGVRRPVCVQVGDQVLFSKFAGTKIQDKGKEFILMKDIEILAVERPEEVLVPAPPVQSDNETSEFQN